MKSGFQVRGDGAQREEEEKNGNTKTGNAVPVPVSTAQHPALTAAGTRSREERGKKCENSASGTRCERKVPPGPAHRVGATVSET